CGAGADDGIGTDAGFGEEVEIALDPVHGAGAESLDAGGLQRLENGARFRVRRGGSSMNGDVVVPQAKRGRVCGAPGLRDQPRLEGRTRARPSGRLSRAPTG